MKLSKFSAGIITDILNEKENQIVDRLKHIKASNNIVYLEMVSILEIKLQETKQILEELKKEWNKNAPSN